MTDEPRSAQPQATPTPPEATASGALAYPRWLLISLGALCAAAWIGAVALDQGSLASTLAPLPTWLLSALRVMLVLVVPTLTLIGLRSPRLPARQHARAFYLVEALAMALVALPALLPLNLLVSLLLPTPIMSLSVVLAAVDPRVSERWRARWDHGIEQWWERKDTGASIALLAGAGYGAVLIVAAITLQFTSPMQCGGVNATVMFCGPFASLALIVFCAAIFLSVCAVMCAALMGYALGARIAQSDRWQ